MLIYSSDQYFSLAMNEILSEFQNRKTKELILIDSGKKDLYIFEVKTLSGILHQDSFSALINSQYGFSAKRRYCSTASLYCSGCCIIEST